MPLNYYIRRGYLHLEYKLPNKIERYVFIKNYSLDNKYLLISLKRYKFVKNGTLENVLIVQDSKVGGIITQSNLGTFGL